MKGEIEAGGLRWAQVLRGNRWNGPREVLGRGKKGRNQRWHPNSEIMFE